MKDQEGTLRIKGGELEDGTPMLIIVCEDGSHLFQLPLPRDEARRFIEALMEAYGAIFEGREMENILQ